MKISILVLLAVVAGAPALAQTPTTGSWREMVERLRAAPVVPSARRGAPAPALAMSIIDESEPNDSVPTADSVALGDQATGVVNPAGDVDTWFVDLTAGQFFSADVDAAVDGSPLDATLILFAPDGKTVLASNDDFDGFDSRISYRVPTGGRYYVAISSFGRSGGSPGARYALNLGTVICAAVGTEREPNDAPASAALIPVGDSGTGELCAHDANPAGDVDYWAFTGQAGTTIHLDVDAADRGIFFVDPAIALFASDGTTRLAFDDDANGPDPSLEFSIITTGTYYAAVFSIAEPSGNPFPYALHVRTTAPGPGDPITVRAEGIGTPLGLAVGSTGDLFIGDLTGSRVVRVATDGTVTTFATGITSPIGLAFDASGNLLVASLGGAVYRVTPQGQATRFITDAGFPLWIAVGPDGRVWLTDLSDRSLRRYSATGQLEARFDGIVVGGFGPGPLAIGPSGEPYISSGTEIWKLVDGQFQRVLEDTFVIWAFAFDVAGNVYIPAPTAGRIQLFDRTGTSVADPFAVGPDAPQAVAFGRDATGATLARLFATDPQVGRLIEMNPAGVQHRGLPVGFVARPVTLDVAAAGLLGGNRLSEADEQYLDGLGNRNGRYDVGDFQAYLRLVGTPPGTAATTTQRRSGSDR